MIGDLLSSLAGKTVVLASSSPRRKEILSKLGGLQIKIVPSTFPEDLDKAKYSGAPERYVVDNARFKALDVQQQLTEKQEPVDLIIACDTVVTYKGVIYEKPENREHAFQVLKELSGDWQQVYSGVAILVPRPRDSDQPFQHTFFEKTEVKFGELSDQLIEAYLNTNEYRDRAGSYGIESLGANLVEAVNGCFYNVVGFPLYRFTNELLQLQSKGIL